MTEVQISSELSKSKWLVVLEYVLFILCLCVIGLRATLTEGLTAQLANHPITFSSSTYSLSISAVLIFSFIVWLAWSFCSKKFYYRLSGVEVGLCLFCAASIVAGLAASNKRAAVTDFATFVAPPMMAILLVQILDSQSKIKLLLVFIVALGVVSAYQCADQFFISNQMTIEQYEQAPWTMLEPLGIQRGTFAHWMFEQRLYSKDVRGFLTTGNSAGSFALLASFAGVVLLIDRFKNCKSDTPHSRSGLCFFTSGPWRLISCGIAVVAVVFGLAITRSKGAITASVIAAVMFIAYLLSGNWLKRHKKAILTGCLLLMVAGGFGIVSYGLAHGRLPGGNSMLVRWQYWCGTAKMSAEHPFTGVGPGNFALFYPRYKPASAPETVADPHNFLLSILAQYGPVGLIGFLAMVLVPLWRGMFNNYPSLTVGALFDDYPRMGFKLMGVICLTVVSICLLVIRPMILRMPAGGSLEERQAAEIILYVMPVVVFIAGFLLLTAGEMSTKTLNTDVTIAALFCAVSGVLIHNLIDFAIFEPGVFTAFWAIMACLIALDFNRGRRAEFVVKSTAFVKTIVVVAGLVIILAYLNYALIPVAVSTAGIRQANQAVSGGRFEQAHKLLNIASEEDRLSAAGLSLNGRLYLQQFYNSGSKRTDLLSKAEGYLLTAIGRNKADFKNFERLAEVYCLLAESSVQQVKTNWLNEAFDSANGAIERYPGCGRLRVTAGRIAEQLGKADVACEQYKKAIEIEDSFRRQFQVMYPGYQVFSRLGEDRYQFAKQRLSECVEDEL